MPFFAACRAIYQSDDPKDIYKGGVMLHHLNTSSIESRLFNDYISLSYFELYESRLRPRLEEYKSWDKEFYVYLGVFDLDFKLTDKERDRIASAPMNLRNLKHVFNSALNTCTDMLRPYESHAVYFSGSKGVHVYVFDPRFLVRVEKPGHLTTANLINYFLNVLALPQHFVDMLDTSIYARGHGIRPTSVANPKTGFMPILLHSYNYYDNPYAWLAEQDFSKCSTLPNIATDTTTIAAPCTRTVIRCNASCSDMGKFVQQYIRDEYHIETKLWPLTSKTRADCYRADPPFCLKKGSCHKNKSVYWTMYASGGYAVQKCFSDKCKSVTYLKSNKFDDLLPATVFFQPNEDQSFRMVQDAQSKYLPNGILKEELDVHDRLFIASPMGSGKTYQLFQYIKEQPETFTCLFVGTRIFQVEYFMTHLKDMNFVDYQLSEAAQLGTVPRLAICLNSIVKLMMPTGVNSVMAIPKYDLLVLDEIETLAQSLGSSLLNTGKTPQNFVYRLLGNLIRSSKKTVFMDGLPGYASRVLLEGYALWQETRFLFHTNKPEKKVFLLNSNPYSFENKIVKFLTNNKRVVFVSNSKMTITHYMDKVTSFVEADKKMAVIGGTDQATRLRASNPNAYWTKLDFLAYNTALGPGPSFDVPAHFNSLFVYLSCSSGQPNEIYQLLCRVREYEDQEVYVFIQEATLKNKAKLVDFEELAFDDIYRYHSGATPFLGMTLQETQLEAGEEEQRVIGLTGTKRVSTAPDTAPAAKQARIYTKLKRGTVPPIEREITNVPCNYIHIESSPFVKLCAAVKTHEYRFKESEHLKRELISIIRRNGGLVTDQTKSDDKTKRCQIAYTKLVKASVKDQVDDFVLKRVMQATDNNVLLTKSFLDIFPSKNDPSKQSRFLYLSYCLLNTSGTEKTEQAYMFGCASLDKVPERTESDLVDLRSMPAKPVSNTVAWSVIGRTLLETIQAFANGHLKIGLHGELSGYLSTKDVAAREEEFHRALEPIFQELSKNDPRMFPRELQDFGNAKQNVSTKCLVMLQMLLDYCGYAVAIQYSKSRSSKKRENWMLIEEKGTLAALAYSGKKPTVHGIVDYVEAIRDCFIDQSEE